MDPKKENATTDTGLSEEDLIKGLDQLNDFVLQNDAPTRKDELLKKAMAADLEMDERDELYRLMGGPDMEPETRADTVVKSMGENENLQEAFEISDFLREQHGELVKSLRDLASYQETAEKRQHDFNMVLAKTVHNTATLVKSMSERLGVIERQPVRRPKGIQTTNDQVMQKSFGGSAQDPSGSARPQLTPGVVLSTLNEMMRKSMDAGRKGLSEGGEDLSLATATFEQTKQLTPRMKAEIESYLSNR